MKKLIALVLSLALMGSLVVVALAADAAPDGAEDSYTVVVDGTPVEGEAVVMVPLRSVAEALGFTVTWDGSQAAVDTGDIHTNVVAGVDRYVLTTSHPDLVGMSAPFSLGVPPYRQDGVTYVPVGLFAALLGNRDGAVAVEDGQIRICSGADAVAS